MTRQFHQYGFGRVDVYPFKYKDYLEMIRICQVRMEKAKPNSKVYFRWYRNYIMLVLGTNIGARIETLLQLTPKHLEGGYVRIKEFKTSKVQKFIMNEDIYDIVQAYILALDISPHDYIFKTTRESDKPLTRQQAYNIIRQLADTIGIKYPVGCHSLRKSFGRFMYDKKHDIYTVQRLLGHSTSKITEKYICVKDDEIEKIRQKTSFL